LAIAEHDMDLAVDALSHAVHEGASEKLSQHLFAIAVAYDARPFCQTRKWSRVGQKWERFDDPQFLETHRFICQWPDAAVAHSDDEFNEVDFMPTACVVPWFMTVAANVGADNIRQSTRSTTRNIRARQLETGSTAVEIEPSTHGRIGSRDQISPRRKLNAAKTHSRSDDSSQLALEIKRTQRCRQRKGLALHVGSDC
jgi:hypothetical protein